MKQLSGLDATFLYLETAQMPMHVGALHVFELPAGYKGRFVRDLRKHMAERLPMASVMRRKLWWMPLNLANPAWVDDEPDLTAHIVEIKLPKAARQGDGMQALEACVSELHSVLLDRKRPLWKMHVLEGLGPDAQGRKRVGLYTQLHHAAVDGQAAVALANVILDLEPKPPAVVPRASTRQKVFHLGMAEMLRGALATEARQVAGIIQGLPATVGALTGVARQALAGSTLLGGRKGKVSNLTLAPRTPLNVSVTEGRAFATATLPLPEFKALAKAHGATVNDLVLMVVSTALRRHYGKKRALPRKSMVAAVPVSLRAAGDGTANTQASMSLMSLGTHLADPARRLRHILEATAAMKSTLGRVKGILPTDFPSIGVPWLIEAATALYGKAKVADRIPQVANLVISNVPGPPVPLYMAGARMLSNYPTSIVTHGLALNITVQSYHQSLDFGLMADAQAMPDVRELAAALLVAFDDVRGLSLPGESDDEDHDPPKTRRSSVEGGRGSAASLAAEAVGRALPKPVKRAAADASQRVSEAAVRMAAKALPKVAQTLANSAWTQAKTVKAKKPAPGRTGQTRAGAPIGKRGSR